MVLRVSRETANEGIGRPYFYYENVTRTLKGASAQISQSLYDIEFEFFDSSDAQRRLRRRRKVMAILNKVVISK